MSFEEMYEELRSIKFLLLSLKEQSFSAQSEPDRWLNLQEFCEYHPDDPAEQTVYGWVSNKAVPHYKKGKKISFLKSEIDAWLKAGRKKTRVEIAIDADKHLIKKRHS